MALEGDPISRGRRVQEIQGSAGAMAFANRLNAIATELDFPAAWTPARLSKVRNGTQDLSIEDMTVIARADSQKRGWTWVSYGVALDPGEDAWAVLARMAKKRKPKAG